MLIPAITPNPRPRGLLLDALDPLPVTGDRWREGVTFLPLGVIPVSSRDAALCSGDVDGDPHDWTGGEDIDLPMFKPFTIYDTENCSALDLDVDELGARTAARVRLSLSRQIAAELVSGEKSGGTSFADTAQTMPTRLGSEVASAMEGAVGAWFGDSQAILHVPAAIAPLFAGSLSFVDGRWLTPTGHIVVFDSAYETDETGGDVYVTGPIQYHIGPNRFASQPAVEYLDRTRNVVTGRTEREAIFAFDPATVLRFPFTWPS